MSRATRKVAVLGSTGSIGTQALDVIAQSAHPDAPFHLELVALSAGTSWEKVAEQAPHGAHVLLADAGAAAKLREARPDVVSAENEEQLLDEAQPDLVLNAVVGFAGLRTTLAALERGVDVALANKESLVAAGALCRRTAAQHDAQIIPVDSEHSALQQCWAGSDRAEVDSLVLTASGGPFYGKTRSDLEGVTVEQALDHPTWKMGGKITVDSATLMNKGLELIEAAVLFDMPPDRIEIAVHRHSIVHALVRHTDGSLLAHLGWPDMRVPIAWALHHPRRAPLADVRRLDLVDMPALEFHQPDTEAFPCLAYARAAAEANDGMPCVLNAANEVAVHHFLDGSIGFMDIPRVVEACITAISGPTPASLEEAEQLDARAREHAARVA